MDGRGRYIRTGTKTLLCELLALDMRDFTKYSDPNTFEWATMNWTSAHGHKSSISYRVQPGEGVRLIYTVGKTDELDYLVKVTSTPCNLGGVRYWWICPHCGRRCRVLYGGKYFLCRKCNSHAYYETQRDKNMLTRIDNELTAIRRRLKAKKTLATTAALPDKPKGMHWLTYMRLAKRYNHLQECRMLSIGIDVARIGEAMGVKLMKGATLEDLSYQLQWLINERG